MRKKGKIVFWNSEKAFGFIEPRGGGKQIFAHITSFSYREQVPSLGRSVSFELATDKQGRLNAEKILFAGEKSKSKKPGFGKSGAFAVVMLYFVLLTASIGFNKLPLQVLYWQLAISFFTYMVYVKDKSAAQKDRWRTPESTLHLLALIGGWPGALLAQKRIRHKSTKRSFRRTFWFTVFLSLSLMVWLHTKQGQIIMGDFTGLKPSPQPQIEWSRPR